MLIAHKTYGLRWRLRPKIRPSFYIAKLNQGCILAGISFLSIASILLPTRKSGIRRDKYLSAAIFKEAVHSDDS